MRTAVVRVGVDPAGELAPAQLTDGMAALRGLAGAAGIERGGEQSRRDARRSAARWSC